MTRFIFALAFLLGALAVVWMGGAFVGTDALALTVTVVIGCVYILGFVELLQYRQATATLASALTAVPASITVLSEWLNKLHPSLQNAARLRIEGERVGLPAPVLTPYLVGLLVMLGLLGTFFGMVDTLKGAVSALEGTTELLAVRAGLAAPIKGLGLAFGTSVAGVAASAMLGLMSTLSRRERMLETRSLDNKIATSFKEFSLVHNRQETFKAMQAQAQALPEVAQSLQLMADRLAQMGDNLGDKLIANQEKFHHSVERNYSDLASSVEHSLKTSLAESGRLVGQSIEPVVKQTMEGIHTEAANNQQQLTATIREQLETVSHNFKAMATSVTGSVDKTTGALLERQAVSDKEKLERWENAFEQSGERSLKQQQQITESLQQATIEIAECNRSTSTQLLSEVAQLLQSSEALVQTRIDNEAAWLSGHDQRMTEVASVLTTELTKLREQEEHRGQAAVDRLAGLESVVTTHLSTLGSALEEPMTRLIETASETPRAAAQVITHLRDEIANTIERDNDLLAERKRIMAELDTLSGSLEQTSSNQRDAIETLVNTSAKVLQEVGAQFSEQVGSETSKLTSVAEHFSGSAVEMSSLSEAFSLAVNLFSESNQHLVENLNRIEQSMDQTSTRNDEQLAYYVAQAREIIDHSMMSQKEVFDELRQLSQQEHTLTAEVE